MKTSVSLSLCLFLVLFLGFFSVFSYSNVFIFVLFYFIVMPYRSVYFLLRDRKWVGLDGREIGEKLGGVEGELNLFAIKEK